MVLQTLLATLFYLATLGILIVFVHKRLHFPLLLSLPITLTLLTFSEYLTFFLPVPPLVQLILAGAGVVGLGFFLTPGSAANYPKIRIPKLMLLLAVGMSLVILIPRLPFLVNPFLKDIIFPYVGDETKHIAVLASLTAAKTFPPRFSYDPTELFPYYYFFYLPPAMALRVFPHAINGIPWTVHVFIAQVSVYAAMLFVLTGLTKKKSLLWLGFLLAIFGPSLKAIPRLFRWYGYFEPHIEHWFSIPKYAVYGTPGINGWQITHPMTLSVWTPQHLFAAAIALLVVYFVLEQHKPWQTYAVIALLTTVMLGTSAFVAAGFLMVLAGYCLIQLRSFRAAFALGLSVALGILFFAPLFILFKNNPAGLIWRPYFPQAPLMPWLPGAMVYYGIETGILIPMLAVLSFLVRKKIKTFPKPFLLLSLAVWVPLVAARLVQSKYMNDWGMRVPIIFTVSAPLLIVYLLDQLKGLKSLPKTILVIFLATIAVSAFSGLMEVYFQSRSFERYPEVLSRVYQVMNRMTNPNDVIITNDAYISDRIPLFANRMTIKPGIPFSMEVYVPKRQTLGEKYYNQELCPYYQKFVDSHLPYRLVYVEMQNVPQKPCADLQERKDKGTLLFSSPSINLYRLP